MNATLEDRIRAYGDDLDRASDHVAIVSVERVGAPPPSRAGRLLAVAGALSVAAAAVMFLVVDRDPSDEGPASAPTSTRPTAAPTSTMALAEDYLRVAYSPGDWIVVPPSDFSAVTLAESVVPWYVLSAESAAGFDNLGVMPGDGNWLFACSEWSVEQGAVECTAVESNDDQPSAVYADSDGRSVRISTAHDVHLDAENYARTLLETVDEREAPPVPEQVTTGDITGWYAEYPTGSGMTRLFTWTPASGESVAVATDGLTRDELLELVSQVDPLSPDALPAVPLVLARSNQPDLYVPWTRDDRVLGVVADGQICAFDPSHILGDDEDGCVTLGSDPMMVIAHGQVAGRYTGLVSDAVALVRLDFADGTELTVRPTPQPVGDVQAFATNFSAPPVAAIVALSTDGDELMTIDVAALNQLPSASTSTTAPS